MNIFKHSRIKNKILITLIFPRKNLNFSEFPSIIASSILYHNFYSLINKQLTNQYFTLKQKLYSIQFFFFFSSNIENVHLYIDLIKRLHTNVTKLTFKYIFNSYYINILQEIALKIQVLILYNHHVVFLKMKFPTNDSQILLNIVLKQRCLKLLFIYEI